MGLNAGVAQGFGHGAGRLEQARGPCTQYSHALWPPPSGRFQRGQFADSKAQIQEQCGSIVRVGHTRQSFFGPLHRRQRLTGRGDLGPGGVRPSQSGQPQIPSLARELPRCPVETRSNFGFAPEQVQVSEIVQRRGFHHGQAEIRRTGGARTQADLGGDGLASGQLDAAQGHRRGRLTRLIVQQFGLMDRLDEGVLSPQIFAQGAFGPSQTHQRGIAGRRIVRLRGQAVGLAEQT